ncbi:transposase [Streptomyces sp. TRM72054]|uniref:IS66 family transposase n=1 Tax=Streptomyces sp. TRM72054 TaxID=2870562 RepID=UPI001C8B6190|nr:transposase [Streptomyces sp. TRM72054]MBX9393433.1 transposase [Streptomyces sp. TRM72054]
MKNAQVCRDRRFGRNRPKESRHSPRRLLLEAVHQHEDDFLRFTTDLRIPPTSNQAERDLRLCKIQESISGRLTDLGRAKDRYLIRGALPTAVKHAVNPLTVLRDAFTRTTWLPPAARA